MDPTTPGGRATLLEGENWRGTGFAISPRLIFTALHVVTDPRTAKVEIPQVRILGAERLTEAEILWSSDTLDIALLKVNSAAASALEGVRCNFGHLIGSTLWQAEFTGYFADNRSLDSVMAVRIIGTADAGAWPESRDIRFDSSRPDPGRGGTGSGLCVDGRLVGIIVRGYATANWCRAASIAEVIADDKLRRILKRELGYVPEVEDMVPPEPSVSGALKDVSKADPANIQEVAAAQFGLSNLYYENVLAQARRSFHSAVAAAVVGLAFFLAAVTFAMVTNQMTASVISVVGGGVVEVVAGLNFWAAG